MISPGPGIKVCEKCMICARDVGKGLPWPLAVVVLCHVLSTFQESLIIETVPGCPEKTLPEVQVQGLDHHQSNSKEELEERRTELSQLEIEVAELRKDIDFENNTLEELKKMTQDFAVVKAEMAKVGIGGPDSAQFVNVIHEFRKYGYSPTKIMKVFAEIIDIKHAREELKRQRKEVEEQREVLDRKLEEIDDPYAFQIVINTLGINLDQLKSAITHLISLEQMGIGVEQIVGICRNLRQNQIRRQQWERGQEWNAQYMNQRNNGHGGQGQNQGYNNYG